MTVLALIPTLPPHKGVPRSRREKCLNFTLPAGGKEGEGMVKTVCIYRTISKSANIVVVSAPMDTYYKHHPSRLEPPI